MFASWLLSGTAAYIEDIPTMETAYLFTDYEIENYIEALECESDIEGVMFTMAMEGAAMDSLKILHTGLNEVRKNKSAIKKLAKEGHYSEAASLSRDTIKLLDNMERQIRDLPPDAGSAILVAFMIALATVLAAIGGMALGKKLMGTKVNMKVKKTAAAPPPVAEGASKFDRLGSAADAAAGATKGPRKITIGQKIDRGLANAKVHLDDSIASAHAAGGAARRTTYKTRKKNIIKDARKAKMQAKSNLTGDARKQAIQAATKTRNELLAAAKDEAKKLGTNKTEAELRKAVHAAYRETRGAGEVIGKVAGGGLATTALGSFLKSKGLYITGEKKKTRPKGEKMKLSPNDYNAMISACLKSIRDTRKKLEQMASFYEKQAKKGAAVESFLCNNGFECVAAWESIIAAENFTEEEIGEMALEAMEGFLDGITMDMDDAIELAAMEGTNIDGIRIYNATKKEIRSLRSEMHDLEKKKDYKGAAEKAREIAGKWTELEKAINDLPQSIGSKSLINILYTTLSLLAMGAVLAGGAIALKKVVPGGVKGIGKNIKSAATIGEVGGRGAGAVIHEGKKIVGGKNKILGKGGAKGAEILADKMLADKDLHKTTKWLAKKAANTGGNLVGKRAGGGLSIAKDIAAGTKLAKKTDKLPVKILRDMATKGVKNAMDAGGATGRIVGGAIGGGALLGSSAMATLALGKVMISSGLLTAKGKLKEISHPISPNDKNKLLRSLKQACQSGRDKYLAAASRYEALAKTTQAATESFLLSDSEMIPQVAIEALMYMGYEYLDSLNSYTYESAAEAWLRQDGLPSDTVSSWLL